MSLKDQKVQLDEYKLILTVLLAFFMISSGFLYVQNQELGRLTDIAEAEMTSARQDAEKLENTAEKQNETIEELRSQVNTLEKENNELTEEASQYIVTASYQGITDNDLVNVEITNYGEQQTNMTGTCQGRKQNADQYQNFNFEIDNFSPQNREHLTIDPDLDYKIQNLVGIQCDLVKCSENCKPGYSILNG